MEIKIDQVTVRVGKEQKKLFSIKELKIPANSHVLIKGESGKGKTTFLHLMAGLLQPNTGKIYVGGTDLSTLNDSELSSFRRHQMAIIFQKLNLINHLSIVENIDLAVAKKNKNTNEILKSLGLQGRENEYVKSFSLGEQQRVAIARVLAGTAKIILADEPTSSLDERNTEEVMQQLLLAAKDKTLIVVSHDPRVEKFFNTVLRFEEVIQ